MFNHPIRIRPANPDDCQQIFDFICELAEFENLRHEVSGSAQQLQESLFGAQPYAEVLIAEYQQQAAGFALFFHNYSTFLTQPGIYLEDLFVKPQFRSFGIGQALLVRLAEIARERDCGRLEWWVLDWNKRAAEFYRRLGAEAMDDWLVYRLSGDALDQLAATSSPSPN